MGEKLPESFSAQRIIENQKRNPTLKNDFIMAFRENYSFLSFTRNLCKVLSPTSKLCKSSPLPIHDFWLFDNIHRIRMFLTPHCTYIFNVISFFIFFSFNSLRIILNQLKYPSTRGKISNLRMQMVRMAITYFLIQEMSYIMPYTKIPTKVPPSRN